jgi:Gpi18-like mannosyltransferase
MNKNITKYLVLFFAGATSLTLRFYFLQKQGFSSDIGLFIYWADIIRNNGFWSLYVKDFYLHGLDYPPLVPLLTSWWLSLGQSLHIQNTNEFFKILPTLADIGLVVATSFVILKSDTKYKYFLLAFVIIQPALALDSALWGQVDSMMALFILLGFLLFEKSPTLATLSMFIAFLVKPQSAIAVGFYFLYFLVRKRYKSFFIQAAIFLGLIIVLSVLFYLTNGSNFLDSFTKAVGRYQNLSLNAFNIWWGIFGRHSWDLMDNIGIPTDKLIGLGMFGLFEIPAFIYLFLKARRLSDILLVVSYSYLIFFVFPTEIHERYLFPAVALMAIPAIKNWKILLAYIVISATFLVNVFAVLQSVYPQFGFLQFNLLDQSWTRYISWANLIMCLFLAIYLYDESFKKD